MDRDTWTRTMKQEDIFYPNKLTPEELELLEGWKLKIATMHFGVSRNDCVTEGYGYAMLPSIEISNGRNIFSPSDTIHVVACNRHIWVPPIDLWDEIDWNDPAALLKECGASITDIYKDRISDQLNILQERENED